jgi:hypothetical protein
VVSTRIIVMLKPLRLLPDLTISDFSPVAKIYADWIRQPRQSNLNENDLRQAIQCLYDADFLLYLKSKNQQIFYLVQLFIAHGFLGNFPEIKEDYVLDNHYMFSEFFTDFEVKQWFENNCISLDSCKYFPETSGVYCVIACKGSECHHLYIGKSVNLLSRWEQHHKQKEINAIQKLGFRITYKYIANSLLAFDISEVEEMLILAFKPILNSTQPSPEKYTAKLPNLLGCLI